MPDPDSRANLTLTGDHKTLTIGPGEFSGLNTGPLESNLLTAGEAIMARELAPSSSTMTSGVIRLTYFTARKTETITQVRLISTGTAAGATPTLVRAGLYTIADNGDLTLAAAIANDTALFAAANTAYDRTLTASFAKVAGVRYAFGLIVVTAAAAPTVLALAPSGPATGLFSVAPRMAGAVNAQTDLLTPIPVGSISDSNNRPQAILLP